jgi:TrmH family RNA methyltransferase
MQNITENFWSSPEPGLRIICPLGDPSNLGALIRTASALGVHSIVLCQEAAHAYLTKTIRTSSGTVFSAPLLLGPSLNECLDQALVAGSSALVLDREGENLLNFKWPQRSFLFVGEEGPGLPDHDLKKLHIPMSSNVESLNAVVAASIGMFSYFSYHS